MSTAPCPTCGATVICDCGWDELKYEQMMGGPKEEPDEDDER